MADLPTFETFYEAANGRAPFPWQSRLAALVIEEGWPTEIGVPTGLGKTSCIDIAVWAMAHDAKRPPRERIAPTRVWYVVNRRLLVDTALTKGRHLARILAEPDTVADLSNRAVLGAVAAALVGRRGGAGADPLHVTRLRGGAELGARPPDPSQPALLFATVPMFASRWLFRGFGSSTSMHPVDAALAGTDSLVLVDEAHLARPLLALGDPLERCDASEPGAVLASPRSRPVLVSLTATGDDAETFTLDEADMGHRVVRRRINASKPVTLVTTNRSRLVTATVDQAISSLAARPPSSAVVFLNAPSTAREVFGELGRATTRRRDPLDADVELLTGRIREREASAVRARLLDERFGAPAGRTRGVRDRHLVVVATQTLEVGADLDFDLCITELCGARALVQRLGRLNRLGEATDAAGAIVCAKDETTFGIYGDEPLEVWQRLREASSDGVVDLGPRAVRGVVGPPADDSGRTGVLLPGHLWEWAKTTTPPAGEAPPELFYDGIDAPERTVSVLWRTFVPDAEGAELHPSVSAEESVEIPIREARAVLGEMGDGTCTRLAPDRVTVQHAVAVGALRPGDVVIEPASAGGYDEHGWAPGPPGEVFDPSLLRPPGIPLLAESLGQLFGAGEELIEAERIAKALCEPPDIDEDLDRANAIGVLEALLRRAGPSSAVTQAEWDDVVGRFEHADVHLTGDVGRLGVARSARSAVQAELRSDGFDELSFTATSPSLPEHLGSVGELAGRMAAAIGLSDELVEAVAAAGRFHDLGKADERFQRWLDPAGRSPGPVAKSSAPRERWEKDRIAAGWPRGGRHEELSRRLVAAYLADHAVSFDTDLVLHLVVSHHGFGRPLVAGAADGHPTAVRTLVEGEAVEAPADLSVVDWDHPARFRRCCERYGYWGLALLEAVVRQADHQVSQVVVA